MVLFEEATRVRGCIFNTLACTTHVRCGERWNYRGLRKQPQKEGTGYIPLKWVSQLVSHGCLLLPSSCKAAVRFTMDRWTRTMVDNLQCWELKRPCWFVKCVVLACISYSHSVIQDTTGLTTSQSTLTCRFWLKNFCVMCMAEHIHLVLESRVWRAFQARAGMVAVIIGRLNVSVLVLLGPHSNKTP